ncbi:MAG TPA: hypothetical protein ENK85_01375 [Saprospiraceae bacterium]|nr:hypothetical protein [Saprospiraceae bacterium]
MKKILVLLFVLGTYYAGHAQKLVGVGKMVQGGVADGEKLLDAYLLPVNRAMIVGLNNSGFSGAYDSEDEHRFSLSLNMSLISVPTADKTFNVNDLALESVEPKEPTHSIAQTAFGDSTSIKLVSKFGIGSVRYFSINTLEGSEQNALPLPYLQATYRPGKGTIGFQVIPPVILPKSDIRVWLAGANFYENMEGVLPFMEALPFDIYFGGGVFIFKGHSKLDVEPGDVKVNLPITNDTKGPYDNQELKIGYTGFYGTAYATMKINIFTPFVGIGFNSGSSTFDVIGTYPVYAKSPGSFIGIRAKDVENPISSSSTYSRIKLEAGGRFDFGRFFAQASYTLANYGGLGGSLGIRF